MLFEQMKYGKKSYNFRNTPRIHVVLAYKIWQQLNTQQPCIQQKVSSTVLRTIEWMCFFGKVVVQNSYGCYPVSDSGKPGENDCTPLYRYRRFCDCIGRHALCGTVTSGEWYWIVPRTILFLYRAFSVSWLADTRNRNRYARGVLTCCTATGINCTFVPTVRLMSKCKRIFGDIPITSLAIKLKLTSIIWRF